MKGKKRRVIWVGKSGVIQAERIANTDDLGRSILSILTRAELSEVR